MAIRWVLAGPHWMVTVTKVKKGSMAWSRTNWWARTIILDSNDVDVRTRLIGPSKEAIGQVPVAHEFGHTIGNVSAYARGDEYEAKSDHSTDVQSIMNRGLQLCLRHFDALIMDLNEMIEGTTFSVGRVQ